MIKKINEALVNKRSFVEMRDKLVDVRTTLGDLEDAYYSEDPEWSTALKVYPHIERAIKILDYYIDNYLDKD